MRGVLRREVRTFILLGLIGLCATAKTSEDENSQGLNMTLYGPLEDEILNRLMQKDDGPLEKKIKKLLAEYLIAAAVDSVIYNDREEKRDGSRALLTHDHDSLSSLFAQSVNLNQQQQQQQPQIILVYPPSTRRPDNHDHDHDNEHNHHHHHSHHTHSHHHDDSSEERTQGTQSHSSHPVIIPVYLPSPSQNQQAPYYPQYTPQQPQYVQQPPSSNPIPLNQQQTIQVPPPMSQQAPQNLAPVYQQPPVQNPPPAAQAPPPASQQAPPPTILPAFQPPAPTPLQNISTTSSPVQQQTTPKTIPAPPAYHFPASHSQQQRPLNIPVSIQSLNSNPQSAHRPLILPYQPGEIPQNPSSSFQQRPVQGHAPHYPQFQFQVHLTYPQQPAYPAPASPYPAQQPQNQQQQQSPPPPYPAQQPQSQQQQQQQQQQSPPLPPPIQVVYVPNAAQSQTTRRPRPSPQHIYNQVHRILDNVAWGNIPGIVDQALGIRTPTPTRNFVTGILDTVFCLPINRATGTCRGTNTNANKTKT